MCTLQSKKFIYHLILLSLGTMLFGGCSQSHPLEKVLENKHPSRPTSAESPAVAKEPSHKTASESTPATKMTVVNSNSELDNDSVSDVQKNALNEPHGERESSTITINVVTSAPEPDNDSVSNVQENALSEPHGERESSTITINVVTSAPEPDNDSVPNAQESALNDTLGEEESSNTAEVTVEKSDLEPVNAISPKDASACCIAELSFLLNIGN
jgi:hypothetical protein